MELQRMSDAEAQVMQVLWEAPAPVTSAWVIQQLQKNRDWKPSTVWTFLGRLVDKGLVSTQRQGKANLYAPAVTREEYRAQETREFLQMVHGGSVKSLVAALDGGSALTPQELEELRSWLLDR